MSKAVVLLVVLCCAFLAGCSAYNGAIYTDVKKPGSTEPIFTGYGDAPGAATTAVYRLDQRKGPGSKCGESSMFNILGLVAIGDLSVETAALNGDITTIHTIDQKTWSVLSIPLLPIFRVYTTRVTGE